MNTNPVKKTEPINSTITINYHETATNSITDLTGTKWQFNSGVKIDNTDADVSYNLNFRSNNTEYGVFRYAPTGFALCYRINSSDIPGTVAYQGKLSSKTVSTTGTWADEAYRTIEITGGTDATNATLISWLQANATQVVEPAITDLTGTKWLLNSSIVVDGDFTYNFNFDTNSTSYTRFQLWTKGYYPGNFRWNLEYSNAGVGGVEACSSASGWSNQAYRTIEITGGTDATNTELIMWLQANATQIEDESNPISIGNLPIANMYFGTQQVKKVYLGNTLVWEKEATVIKFTIDGDTYQAESGMTWQAWVNSAYNTGGFKIENNKVVNSSSTRYVADADLEAVILSDSIIADDAYRSIYL